MELFEKYTNWYELQFYAGLPAALRPFCCACYNCEESADRGFAEHSHLLRLEKLEFGHFVELKLGFAPVHPLHTLKYAKRLEKCGGSLTESHGFRVHSAFTVARVVSRPQGYQLTAQETASLLHGFLAGQKEQLLELLRGLRRTKEACKCEIFGPDLLIYRSDERLRIKLIDFAFSRLSVEFDDRLTESLENLITFIDQLI